MENILVDTDIVIDYAYQKNKLLQNLLDLKKDRKVELFVNPVIITEYFADNKLTRSKIFKEAQLIFSAFVVIDLTSTIGYIAGELMRLKRVISIGDALNAATCLENNCKLATRNLKHFRNIPGLLLYTFS